MSTTNGLKLWVDDIRNPPDGSWTVARTINGAILALDLADFDEISLDHDISHQLEMGGVSRPYPCRETFRAVAHYIAVKYVLANTAVQGQTERTNRWQPRIIIHSSNPVGADEMRAILDVEGLSTEYRPMGAANRLELEV